MDDETYVKSDFKQLPGQSFYVSKVRRGVKNKFKLIRIGKFPKKHMIWQAICTCGLKSQPYVAAGSINSNIYITECLQKILLPFLQSHSTQPLFWPDLASCHYSKLTLKWYAENNINFVQKYHNPPNCPELRPIEVFWAKMKQILRKMRNPAKDVEDFKRKWKIANNIMDQESYND